MSTHWRLVSGGDAAPSVARWINSGAAGWVDVAGVVFTG